MYLCKVWEVEGHLDSVGSPASVLAQFFTHGITLAVFRSASNKRSPPGVCGPHEDRRSVVQLCDVEQLRCPRL
jgi:hypothetical protein